MSIELTPEQQAIIQNHVGSDPYDSPKAVIDQALEDFGRKRAFFLREIKPAIAELDRGEGTPLDMEEIIAEANRELDEKGVDF